MIVEGQVHGGVVQGIGQALWEEAVYDENGQLITGSMLDYARAARRRALPTIEVLSHRDAVAAPSAGPQRHRRSRHDRVDRGGLQRGASTRSRRSASESMRMPLTPRARLARDQSRSTFNR